MVSEYMGAAVRQLQRVGLDVDRLKPRLRDGVAEILMASRLTAPRRVARSSLTVLTFHRVLPPKQLTDYPMRGLAITPEGLEQILSEVTQQFCCVPLTSAYRLWSEGSLPSRPLLSVTFDDGALDNFEHARPVLDACGVRASFYIPVAGVHEGKAPWHDRLGFALLGALSKLRSLPAREVDAWLAPFGATARDLRAVLPSEARRLCERAVQTAKGLPFGALAESLAKLEGGLGGACVPAWAGLMNWDQIRQLRAEGHEIGSHSMTHPILTECTSAQVDVEIERSKSELEAALGAEVTSFCYPNGSYDDRCLAAVARAGYQCAVTTRWGLNRRGVDPLELSRCDMDYARLVSRRGEFSPARLWFRLSGLQPGLS